MQPPINKRLAAEAIGTFGFFLTGFMGITALTTQGPLSIQAIGIAAGFGFGLALMIFAFGQVSGGHFNPAVTLGLTCAGKHPVKELVPYWVAQVVGGLLASLLLLALYSQEIVAATVNAPGRGVGTGETFVLELVFTALFLLVITTVATDKRAPWSGVFAPFAIGLFIFTAASTVGPISGGSFNPARSLAPAIVAGEWSGLWVYLVAPLIGGAIGGLVHAWFASDSAPAPREEILPE